MKILQINKYHYLKGGAERCYFDTAEILKNHGHETAFFSMNHEKNFENSWSGYFIDGVDYLDERKTWLEKGRESLKIIYNFQAKRNLEKLLKNFKPKVVHLHNIYHQISPSIIPVLKKHNIPIVMTLHDYKLISPNYSLCLNGQIYENTKPNKYYRCVADKCVKDSYAKSLVCAVEAYLHRMAGLYGKIDRFISPSRFLISKFREFGFKHEIEYLPNPLIKDGCRIDGEIQDYFIYFGRLSKEKGVDDLIMAYADSKAAENLVIAGEGPERKILEKKAVALGLSQKVRFTGYKSGEELVRLVSGSKAVVFSSRWYENAPYSLIEAMNYSKTCICPMIGGFTEVIQSGENGILYQFGSRQELSLILKTIGSYNLEAIGKSARNWVEKTNSEVRYYHKLMEIYHEIIK